MGDNSWKTEVVISYEIYKEIVTVTINTYILHMEGGFIH
jgi:hypothetical protein